MWKKVILAVRVALLWRQAGCDARRTGFSPHMWRQPNSLSHEFMRSQLLVYIQTAVDKLTKATAGARHSARGVFLTRFDDFNRAMADTLVMLSAINNVLINMGKECSTGDASAKFLSMNVLIPDFRRAVAALVLSLEQSLLETSKWLTNLAVRPPKSYFDSYRALSQSAHQLEHLFHASSDAVQLAIALRCAETQQPPVPPPGRRSRHEPPMSRAGAVGSISIPDELLAPEVRLQLFGFVFLLEALCARIEKLYTPFLGLEGGASSTDECVNPIVSPVPAPNGGSQEAVAAPLTDSGGSEAAKLSAFVRHVIESGLHMWKDIFLPQTKLRQVLKLKKSKEDYFYVLEAVVFAASMLIATLYSFFYIENVTVTAPFTIPFLIGGSAAGASLFTCLNRAVGTVVACVYVALVLTMTDKTDDLVTKNIIIGTAVVLAQYPATLVRAMEVYSTSGTVASFTVCLLLLNPNASAGTASARIVDTFAGVIIYILMGVFFTTQDSEDLFISSLNKIFAGIDVQCDKLVHSFQTVLEKRTAGPSAKNAKRRGSVIANQASVDKVTKTVEDLGKLLSAQRASIVYMRLEPSLWRPKLFTEKTMNDLVGYQGQVCTNLQILVAIVTMHVVGKGGPAAAIVASQAPSSKVRSKQTSLLSIVLPYLKQIQLFVSESLITMLETLDDISIARHHQKHINPIELFDSTPDESTAAEEFEIDSVLFSRRSVESRTVATAEEAVEDLMRVYKEAMRKHCNRYIHHATQLSVGVGDDMSEKRADNTFENLETHRDIKIASAFVLVIVDFVHAVRDLSLCVKHIQASQKIQLSQRDRVKTNKVKRE